MKLSRSFIISSLLHAASVAAADSSVGHAFLYDPQPSLLHLPSKLKAIRSAVAESIFARRLGLSNYFRLEGFEDSEIQQVNVFGGKAQQLLGRDWRRDQLEPDQRVLIVVDGVERPGDVVPSSKDFLSFDYSDATSVSSSLDALQERIEGLPAGQVRPTVAGKYLEEVVKKIGGRYTPESIVTKGTVTMMHFQSLATIAREKGTSSSAYRDAVTGLNGILSRILTEAKDSKDYLTILLNPLGMASAPQKRSVKPGRELSEKPLSPLTSAGPAAANTVAASVSQATNPIDGGTPLGTSYHTCYASQSECQSKTNNCSSHGDCVLKYRDNAAGDDPNNPLGCYGCICNKPNITAGARGNKKTIYYGGNACQKKDISVPFWLFASFTVIMMFLLSWGVGLLYSMGDEELPSVIGAGVSGPKAK